MDENKPEEINLEENKPEEIKVEEKKPDESKPEIKPEENIKPEEKKKNILETGTYSMLGPENGDINIDTIELNSESGAKRIWKIRNMSEKEINLDIVKFG